MLSWIVGFLALALVVAGYVILAQRERPTGSRQAPTRREAGFTTSELEDRFGKLEAQYKTIDRKLEDLDEATGRRFNRLQARLRPERNPDEESDDDTAPTLPDPAQMPLPLTAAPQGARLRPMPGFGGSRPRR